MDPEVLRFKLIAGCNDLAGRMVVGRENRQLAAAGALFWKQATREELERFAQFIAGPLHSGEGDEIAEVAG